MNFLSKSKYVSFCQCEKIIWLDKNKPEEKVITEAMQEIFDNGNMIGDLAMELFGDYVEVTCYKENGKLDLDKMCQRTKEEIFKKTENICEASFIYNGLYCAVDILRKNEDGYDIYEVKSSTHINDVYYPDTAYQKYVLEKCGVNVKRVFVVTINSSYVRMGEIELDKLFKITEVTQEIKAYEGDVEENVNKAKDVLDLENEPTKEIGQHCSKPYDCPYAKYCFRSLPSPNVFDLYQSRKKFSFYNNGIVSFDDLRLSGEKLSKVQEIQVEYYDKDEVYVEKENLREFLNGITYPIYYLDFESMNPAIPPFDNSNPYSQIPFQYSLHIKESETSPLIHKEFLADGFSDPRRMVAESLVNDIGEVGTIVAYYHSFEKSRIDELSKLFSDLKAPLKGMLNRFVDLLHPFSKGYVYYKDMGGSFSIKSVLPSFFKNDPELDYKSLPGVHNGSEAKNVFPKLQSMSEEERNKVRDGLLKYCHLDTLAMVRVHEKLIELAR